MPTIRKRYCANGIPVRFVNGNREKCLLTNSKSAFGIDSRSVSAAATVCIEQKNALQAMQQNEQKNRQKEKFFYSFLNGHTM